MVYKAEDTRLGRNVALKFLPEKFTENREALERFQREARTASSIDHPNICAVYDIGEHAGQPFIVMQQLEGQTLKQLIEARSLDIDEILDLAIQISDALDAAHAKGIVHRDIKPGNIFVTEKNHVKVLDFGLAKLAEEPTDVETDMSTPPVQDEMLTRSGALVGTAPYMSPEQARGKALDPRSDLFSLGVVLYQLATGDLPFQGDTPPVMFDEILNETPISPIRLNPKLPAQLEQLIFKALEKDREVRFQTAKDMLIDLKRLKRDSEDGSGVSRVEESGSKMTHPGYLWPSLAGVLGLVLILGLFWLPGGGSSNEPIDSIAILPFENRSGDPELDFVSDGISEAIINRLSRLSSLNKVISSASLRRFKGREVDPRRVTEEIDVRAIVMGSMGQLGETIRVNVELIDGAQNNTLWGNTYTRPRSTLYEIEAVLSEEISDALGIQLSREEAERLSRQYTENGSAYETYLKGQFQRRRFTAQSLGRAANRFREAIDADPSFAPALCSPGPDLQRAGDFRYLSGSGAGCRGIGHAGSGIG